MTSPEASPEIAVGKAPKKLQRILRQAGATGSAMGFPYEPSFLTLSWDR
jgi:hypothetical protein